MIGLKDVERLCAEWNSNAVSPEEWMEKIAIDSDAMNGIFDSAKFQFAAMIIRGEDPADAIVEIIGQSIVLGWEIRDQYPPKRKRAA